MRIGIDARIANYSASGIARYTRGVLAGVAANLRDDLQCSVLTAARKWYTLSVPQPLTARTVFTPPHSRVEPWSFPLELRAQRLDLLHCMDFFAPHPRTLRAIYSVHDLFFVRDPSLLDRASRRHYLKLIKLLSRAVHAVCISEDTRRELISLTAIDPQKVSVIYPGCEPLHHHAQQADIARVRAALSLPASCILYVGTIEPRKNVPNMVEGYVRAHRMSGGLPPLVLVGRQGYQGAEIAERCRAIAGDNIRIVGGLSDLDLAALYRVADAALFVTGGEGFGFPILEAMHAGIPVVTSNRSASAEIAGTAALKADPDDPDAIASAIVRLYADGELRAALQRQGRLRAESFSWQRCGAELCALYAREVER